MKKFLLVILSLVLNISLFAQCPLTEAVDFTATDCHGTEVHLFDILDGGQCVLIDFFFTTCGPCQNAAPKVVEAYHALGCNDYEVFFMEISPSDADPALMPWVEQYGVEYPTIGTSGGGATICDTYDIPAYPTVILITPDRQIVIQDLWPISNAQTIITALAAYGIEEHECGVVEPNVEITLGEVGATTIEASFAPNEACAMYSILASTAAEMEQWVGMMGVSLEELVLQWGISYEEAETYTWTGMTPETEYTVYALPIDAEGNYAELQTAIATTLPLGGTGTSVIDLQVEIVSETSVTTTAIPNEETAEFHVGLIIKSFFEEIGEEAAVQLMRDDEWPLYATDVWTWEGLDPNIVYYAIATGKNANDEWGETALVEFVTDPDGVAESDMTAFTVYPNPANEMVKISGEGIESVEVFNSLGQKMNVTVTRGADVIIPTQAFESGLYFARINGKSSIRFVVTH